MKKTLEDILATIQPEDSHVTDDVQMADDGFADGLMNETEYILRRMETFSIVLRNHLIKSKLQKYMLSTVEYENQKKKILHEVYGKEQELYGLKISYGAGILHLQIPAVLPHRNAKPGVVYADSLRFMMQGFKENEPGLFSESQQEFSDGVVAVIQHSYETADLVKDNDNVEIKRVLDLLHLSGYIKTDRGDYLSLFLTARTSPSESSFTDIFVMSKQRFPSFLQEGC